MNKRTIKDKVEQAKESYMPKAIKEEAEYRARDEVRRALYQPEALPDRVDDTPAEPTLKTTTFQSNDPRLSGRQ